MKFLLIAMALSAVITNCQGQDSSVIHIWPGQVPGMKESKHPPKVSSDHRGGVTRLTDVTDPVLVVFTPAAGKSNGAGVVVCPGGAYKILAIDLEGYHIAHWLTSLGYTAFVLQYRVPDNQAGALQDVQRSLRLVRSRAKDWGLDAARIGVMGFSAGGSLSARISTEYGHNWYEPVDAADSLSCRPDFTVLIYPAYLDLGKNHSLTPELRITKNTPHMFLFQAADDPYCNSSLTMAGALRLARVPFELHIYPKGGHGYGMRTTDPAGRQWPPLAAGWLAENAGKKTEK